MIFVVAGNYREFTNHRYESVRAGLIGVTVPLINSFRYVGHARELDGLRFDSTVLRLTRWQRALWFLRHWRMPPRTVEQPSRHSVKFVGTWRQRHDAEEILMRLTAAGWVKRTKVIPDNPRVRTTVCR
jgi:hypothetical protein